MFRMTQLKDGCVKLQVEIKSQEFSVHYEQTFMPTESDAPEESVIMEYYGDLDNLDK